MEKVGPGTMHVGSKGRQSGKPLLPALGRLLWATPRDRAGASSIDSMTV